MATRKRERLSFESVEDLLGASVTADGVEEISIKQIKPFKNHPFKVKDNERMKDLIESIKENGILTPVILRPIENDSYEMISGHSRMHAAKLAGLSTIPAITKKMTDEEAVILMVDANIQREEILPSERAFSLKMKMDALRKQGKRTDLSSDHTGPMLAAEAAGESLGISGTQVKRFVRLTELIPELLEMVDKKEIGLVTAVEISFFSKEIQTWLHEYIQNNGKLKPEQLAALRSAPNVDELTQYSEIQILNDALPKSKSTGKVTLSERKLNKYFPPEFTVAQREKVIMDLLEKWQKEGSPFGNQ